MSEQSSRNRAKRCTGKRMKPFLQSKPLRKKESVGIPKEEQRIVVNETFGNTKNTRAGRLLSSLSMKEEEEEERQTQTHDDSPPPAQSGTHAFTPIPPQSSQSIQRPAQTRHRTPDNRNPQHNQQGKV